MSHQVTTGADLLQMVYDIFTNIPIVPIFQIVALIDLIIMSNAYANAFKREAATFGGYTLVPRSMQATMLADSAYKAIPLGPIFAMIFGPIVAYLYGPSSPPHQTNSDINSVNQNDTELDKLEKSETYSQ